MRSRPTYALQSVDAALRLAQMLQAFGPMRVSDAAAELGVAVSTTHRLLSMLVFRGYAEQLPDRRYAPGPWLRPTPTLDPTAAELRERARGPMAALVAATGESANVVVLAGLDVQFVATVECDRVLRVGDRTGQRLPAHLASGGKAILAALPDAELERFRVLGDATVTKLRRDVHDARRLGYACNHQETERGLTAIGVALSRRTSAVQAAVCLAMPTARFRTSAIDTMVSALTDAASEIDAALVA